MTNLKITAFLMLFIGMFFFQPAFSSVADSNKSAVYNGIPENGIFNKWLVVGSIPVYNLTQDHTDTVLQKRAFDKEYVFPSGKNDFKENDKLKVGNNSYSWQYVQTDYGLVYLTNLVGDSAHAVAYAFAKIDVPDQKELLLGIGSDDAVKIWINGKLVHSNWVARGLTFDNDIVPVTLKKGSNSILVKIQNRGYSWGFRCRTIQPSEYSQQLCLNIENDNLVNVKRLLSTGTNINCLSDIGLTPLQTAKMFDKKEIYNFLLEQGADSTLQTPSKGKMVDTYFENILKMGYPGAAVLISKNGEVLHKKAYGYSNLEDEVAFKTDTKFRIASITKTFTATAILKLQEEGLLNLNDSVSKYVPELPRANEIKISHLLTHTSGLQRDLDDEYFEKVSVVFKPEDRISEIKKLKLDFNPGESWSYSNCGYLVLGIIIERASGMTYNDFLRDRFFQPLNMANSGIHQWNNSLGCSILSNDALGYSYEGNKIYRAWNLDRNGGSGSLYSSVEDLSIWNEAWFNNRILNSENVNLALTPVITADGSPDKYGLQYGFGWQIKYINGVKRIFHGGAINGYDCCLNRFPENNMNIIVLMNRFPFPPNVNADIVSQRISQIYLLPDL